MSLFLSTYINKVDKKGRISVPASFRAALATQDYPGIIIFRSLHHDALEACSYAHMQELSANLEQMDIDPEEKDLIATTIFGGSLQLPFDPEGRVTLPQELMSFAQISDQAAFVGRSNTFQIWEPNKFAEYQNFALQQAKNKGLRLSQFSGKTFSTSSSYAKPKLVQGGS